MDRNGWSEFFLRVAYYIDNPNTLYSFALTCINFSRFVKMVSGYKKKQFAIPIHVYRPGTRINTTFLVLPNGLLHNLAVNYGPVYDSGRITMLFDKHGHSMFIGHVPSANINQVLTKIMINSYYKIWYMRGLFNKCVIVGSACKKCYKIHRFSRIKRPAPYRVEFNCQWRLIKCGKWTYNSKRVERVIQLARFVKAHNGKFPSKRRKIK